MKTRTVAFLLFLSMCRCAPLWARVSESDRRQIDRTLGTTGIYTPSEDTYRVTFPRTDVKVTVNNRTLSTVCGVLFVGSRDKRSSPRGCPPARRVCSS